MKHLQVTPRIPVTDPFDRSLNGNHHCLNINVILQQPSLLSCSKIVQKK